MADKREALYTAEDVKQIAEAAALAAVKAALEAQAPTRVGSQDEQFEAWKESMKSGRSPLAETPVLCVSPDTGATFTAIVSPSRAYPHGRVVRIEDYVHPPKSEVHVSEGGTVPDGMVVRNAQGEFDPGYKQWRYQGYWLIDLVRLVGKSAKILAGYKPEEVAA